MDAVPVEQRGGSRQDPVTKSVHPGHRTRLGSAQPVAGDPEQILLKQLANQSRYLLAGVGAVRIHGHDDLTGGNCETGLVGATVSLARFVVDRRTLALGQFAGAICRVAVDYQEVQFLAPAVIRNRADGVDDGSLFVPSGDDHGDMNGKSLNHAIRAGHRRFCFE